MPHRQPADRVALQPVPRSLHRWIHRRCRQMSVNALTMHRGSAILEHPPHGRLGQLAAVAQQELGAQLFAVGLYGMYGEPQLLRDVAGALAVADELEDFELPRAELPRPGRAAASPVEHQLEEPVGQLFAEVALTGRRGANRPDDGARRLLLVHVAVGAAAQGPLSIEGLAVGAQDHDFDVGVARSEERRVGKECRSRWGGYS